MRYIFNHHEAQQHFIDIELIIDKVNVKELKLQLPAWRPGRYELGNFSKNIRGFEAFGSKNRLLKSRKVNKDLWVVETQGSSIVRIKYAYYANIINAGSSYTDTNILYVNPVNCCMYVPDRVGEKCEVQINVPNSFNISTGMSSNASRLFECDSFDELADSPFVASPNLQHRSFKCGTLKVNLWFEGEVKPDWKKLMNDFGAFIGEQLKTMGGIPVKEFHFINIILPYQHYHGVEHLKSTMIVLGPSYEVMKGDMYRHLLGVSSHELFHVWNIKTIRPVEMQPYNFTCENYSKLGYVYEGLTTYYGDLFLFRSGVFSEQEYFNELNNVVQRHFDNFGRFNLSVADSSFDTWLDGYSPGVPYRKTSIYNEGALCAFVSDVLIRYHSQGKYSLDDVCRLLYAEFGKKGIGYSENDYKKILIKYAGNKKVIDKFFEDHINGTKDIGALLRTVLHYIGCELNEMPSGVYIESSLGIKVSEVEGFTQVMAVFPGSIAEKAGLVPGHKVILLNGYKVTADLNKWCEYFKGDLLRMQVLQENKIRKIELKDRGEIYFRKFKINKMKVAGLLQKKLFKNWAGG